jgi:hypothetical protein
MITVVARSKLSVCGRSFTGVAGSNPARSWRSVLCTCCLLSGRGLSCVNVVCSFILFYLLHLDCGNTRTTGILSNNANPAWDVGELTVLLRILVFRYVIFCRLVNHHQRLKEIYCHHTQAHPVKKETTLALQFSLQMSAIIYQSTRHNITEHSDLNLA